MSISLPCIRHTCCRVSRNLRVPSRPLTMSSVQGPLHPPLVTTTLSEYFSKEILEKQSNRPALICRKEAPRAHGGPPSRNLHNTRHLAWDFEEFDRHINAFARGMLNMGVKKGDRVGVIMGNNSAYASLQWACASIGAILVTINPAYHLNEFVNTLNLVGVSHLFIVPRIRSSHYTFLLSGAFPSLRDSSPGDIQEAALPHLKNLVVVNNAPDSTEFRKDLHGLKSAIDWREIMVWREDAKEKSIQQDIERSLNKDDVVNLQFTSGTTGSPKAVSLTHYNLLNNGLSIGRCMRLTSEDILCNTPPLFHCFDESNLHTSRRVRLTDIVVPSLRLVLGNLAAWSHGACIVYPSEVFDPAAIVDAVVEEKCTALHGVPTHFLGVLTEVEKRQNTGEKLDFSRLRTGIAAGSSVPIELMKQLITKLNLVDLTNAYGMTETSPVSFQTTPADSLLQRTETVGKVQPHVKAKLINPEGDVVPIGTPGEICVSGYLVQKGYWEDENQTQSVMRRDAEDNSTLWMHTGDEGIMDDEGYLRIVGRMKDIIIRGGENLFPVQIENAIGGHPAILEAAAVAVPDKKYGEVVGIWVVRQPNTGISREEVRQRVGNHMNPQNVPAWVWFVGEEGAPSELPKTASGKVMKHVLRNWSRDLAAQDVGRAQ